jgi:hypothetical protein
MTTVSVQGTDLVVEVEGLDKLWSFQSRLVIPLDDVVSASTDGTVADDHKGWRGPGTYVPGVIAAGTFHRDGERIFWDVHDPKKVVVIELRHEHFARLVLGVDDPGASADLVNLALAGRDGASS